MGTNANLISLILPGGCSACYWLSTFFQHLWSRSYGHWLRRTKTRSPNVVTKHSTRLSILRYFTKVFIKKFYGFLFLATNTPMVCLEDNEFNNRTPSCGSDWILPMVTTHETVAFSFFFNWLYFDRIYKWKMQLQLLQKNVIGLRNFCYSICKKVSNNVCLYAHLK